MLNMDTRSIYPKFYYNQEALKKCKPPQRLAIPYDFPQWTF